MYEGAYNASGSREEGEQTQTCKQINALAMHLCTKEVTSVVWPLSYLMKD